MIVISPTRSSTQPLIPFCLYFTCLQRIDLVSCDCMFSGPFDSGRSVLGPPGLPAGLVFRFRVASRLLRVFLGAGGFELFELISVSFIMGS